MEETRSPASPSLQHPETQTRCSLFPGETGRGFYATPLSRETDQETDVWYGGYAGRAMLGSFLACLGLTAAALWGLSRYSQLASSQRDALQMAVTALLGATWLFQTFRWGYRKLATSARLTTRRFFYDRGFLYRDCQVVDLTRLGRVEVRRNLWERCLGLGRLHVFGEGNSQPLIFNGISQPTKIADRLRKQAATSREDQIISARVGY